MREIVQAFCEGYLEGLVTDRQFYGTTLQGVDDWVVWRGYDINFVGQDYTSEALGDKALLAVVYPKDWKDDLPDHLFSFVVTTSTTEGESK